MNGERAHIAWSVAENGHSEGRSRTHFVPLRIAAAGNNAERPEDTVQTNSYGTTNFNG